MRKSVQEAMGVGERGGHSKTYIMAEEKKLKLKGALAKQDNEGKMQAFLLA